MEFLKNAISWLSPNPERESVVGVHSSLDILAETLSAYVCRVEKTTAWKPGFGVFCTNGYDDSQAQEILSFVREGGGLLIGAQAWYWSYSHKENNLQGFPGNKITSLSGVYFTEHYGEKGTFSMSKIMPWSPIIEEKFTFDKDYRSLICGVDFLDFSGDAVPCKLLITGDTSFPVLVSPGNDVLVAASRYGKGKMVVLAHESFLIKKELMGFLKNVISWLNPNQEAVVGVHSSLDLLAETLSAYVYRVEKTTAWKTGLGVFCTNGYDDSQAQEILSFVREGGGLLIGAQAWYWSYSHKENVLQGFPGNKITSVSGVYFTEHYGEKAKFIVSKMMPRSPIYAEFDFSSDLKHLLEGVSMLDISGQSIFSDLLLHGALSFPVGISDKNQCFVGAAYYGKGRVVVVTHEGYLFKPESKTLILNAISWLDIGQKRNIGVHSNLNCLADILQKENISSRVTNLVPGLSVYCCQSYSDNEADAIHQFVAEGGGLLIGGHAWYWSYQNSDCNVFTHYPGNKILNKFGISILSTTVPQGKYNAVQADKATQLYHFPKALNHLQSELHKHTTLKTNLSTWMFKLRQDISHFMRLPPCPNISSNQLQIVEKMQICDMPKVNKQCPVSSCSNEALILCLAHEICNVNQVCDQINKLEKEPSITVHIEATNPGSKAWRSTGLYLAPRNTAVVVFPACAVQQGLQVQVGCHTDDLSAAETLCRAPVVVHRASVLEEKVSVTCFWGGLIYIIVNENINLGTIPVKVYGAEQAPTYIKGKTDPKCWVQSISNSRVPWGELITENIILTVPSDGIHSIKDPEALLTLWEKIMVAITELAAIPKKMPRPERIVADVQISAGWMHSGYPIMCHMESTKELTDFNSMRKSGLWGPIHELGHNQQKTVWEFSPHTTEATCNLWSVYVHETVLGIPRSQAHPELQPQNRANRIQMYLRNGSNLNEWNVWTALETYLQLQESFGWEPFKRLFKEYQSITSSYDNNSKMNLWVEKFSIAVEMNLVPFFQVWGWPIEDATRTKLSFLPTWENHPMKPYLSAM
ncbi:hypothetical protein GDO86_006087 [Hymenochirus boettgeri]|uniref:Peptidase M60 domain-containing protein n=1 Tax=Hymenochirus boettgeri TaxID=247094 RepID=A0A8T2JC16_9PIPI|nr:hypothetical protein GDO86_006087 [Hymenochirus boettgeri]